LQLLKVRHPRHSIQKFFDRSAPLAEGAHCWADRVTAGRAGAGVVRAVKRKIRLVEFPQLKDSAEE